MEARGRSERQRAGGERERRAGRCEGAGVIVPDVGAQGKCTCGAQRSGAAPRTVEAERLRAVRRRRVVEVGANVHAQRRAERRREPRHRRQPVRELVHDHREPLLAEHPHRRGGRHDGVLVGERHRAVAHEEHVVLREERPRRRRRRHEARNPPPQLRAVGRVERQQAAVARGAVGAGGVPHARRGLPVLAREARQRERVQPALHLGDGGGVCRYLAVSAARAIHARLRCCTCGSNERERDCCSVTITLAHHTAINARRARKRSSCSPCATVESRIWNSTSISL